jgi:hypothetical protein
MRRRLSEIARYMKRRVVVDLCLSPSHTQKARLFPTTPTLATLMNTNLQILSISNSSSDLVSAITSQVKSSEVNLLFQPTKSKWNTIAAKHLIGGQDSLVGKALDSQAKRYWVRSSPRPQKALNMSDY